MKDFVLLVVVVLGSLTSAQDNVTTVGEIFEEEGNSLYMHMKDTFDGLADTDFSSWNSGMTLTLTMEIFNYTKTFNRAVGLEFIWDLGNVTLQSIYETINVNCSTKIEDIQENLKDTKCAEPLLVKILMPKMIHAIQVAREKTSRDCVNFWPTLCSAERRHCITEYEERERILIIRSAEEHFDSNFADFYTPYDFIYEYTLNIEKVLTTSFEAKDDFLLLEDTYNFTKVSLEPFTVENIILMLKIKHFHVANSYRFGIFRHTNGKSRDKSTWGVVRSNVGLMEGACSRNIGDDDFHIYQLTICYYKDAYLSILELMSCALHNSSMKPLTWLSLPDIYFNSPCLCVAFNGDNCGATIPRGVDPRTYCFSILLRDFQRRISYRPAVTYLDYSFQTRIPLCNFTNFISSATVSICKKPTIDLLLSVRCYFKDLVSKDLNCSAPLPMKPFKDTELCILTYFIESVVCKHDITNTFNVSYYGVGDSNLVLFFTYLDVAARALTSLSYTVCPKLNNLPGKLMMCYLTTALLRLLVVRGFLDFLEWAVKLDVAMDLASTLWLTSYLHFLTTSIKTLRLPDSLSRDEARQVLIRYSLFGWVLPLFLSIIFFCMDEFLDSRVQFGQLMFVLCNYGALLANLYMFFYNCLFYYNVNTSVIGLGVRPRNVFARIFNFALKTSVLSGAGITFRLVLTQIQGLEQFLGYYHVVGTFQGLLLFLLYGCNIEARVFWLSLFRRAIGHCNRRKSSSADLNTHELAEIPATQSLQNCPS